MTAKARKLRADGKGVETEVPLDDWIDVGVFGGAGHERRRKHEQGSTWRNTTSPGPSVAVTVVVDGPPVRAGIDPYNMLIDRTPGDNVRAVTRR